MKTIISFFVIFFVLMQAFAQSTIPGGFQKSIYNDETVKFFSSPPNWAPEVKFHINALSAATFDQKKKVMLIF